jgi:serine/threonine protein kinase/Tfp pilus assembly protein PilF
MVGEKISHYKIIEKIGEGGMGKVYLAEDLELQRQVAIKLLPPQYITDKESKARFKREARAAAALNHPNIITIHEIGEFDNKTYIVMEYVEGRSLKDLIQKKNLSFNSAIEIAIQIGKGLNEAHQIGIVHRDIKPENILLNKNGDVKILDFGLAKFHGATRITLEDSTLGTFCYMSPEQYQNADVDQRSDIWSLGVVLYEMLSGQLPFEGEYEAAVMYSIFNESPPPLKQWGINEINGVQSIVDKMLSKNPNDRYQDLGKFFNDIQQILEPQKIKTSLSTIPKKKKYYLKSSRVIISTIMILIILTGIIFVWFVVKWMTSDKEVEPLVGISSEGRTSIAVMFFDNLTGKQAFNLWERGITELLINELASHPHLEVLDPQTVYFLQQEHISESQKEWSDALTLNTASSINVQVALFGQLYQSNEKLSIRFKLLDVSQRTLIATDELDLNNIDEILDKIKLLSQKVVNHLEVKGLERIRDYYDPDKEILMSNTNSIEAYTHLIKGNQYFFDFKWTLAISEFSEAIKYDSIYTVAYYLLGLIYLNMQSRNEARHLLRIAKKTIQEPSHGQRLLLNALEVELSYNFYEQIKVYKSLLQLNPGHRGFLYSLGYSYSNIGDYPKAIPYLEKVYQSQWKLPFVTAQLVQAYHYAGEDKKERMLYEDFIKESAANPSGYLLKIRHYVVKGNSKKINETINKVVEKAAENDWSLSEIYSEIGQYYLEISEFSSAQEYLTKAIETDSSNVKAWYNAGKISLNKGKLGQSTQILESMQSHEQAGRYSKYLSGQIALSKKMYSE